MADHRFSLFGHKKDSRSQNDLQHDVGGDSAYASSGNAPSLADSKDTVPVENHGQINGVDGDRHLAMNKSTGQIFDDDTGEAVTVVTTTTTTTTTTTRGGKKGTTVDVSTQPSDQSTNSSSVHEAPGDHPGRPEAHNLYGHARPEATAPSQRTAAPEPIVPVRNPNRKSRDYEARRSGDQAWPGFGAYDAPPSPHNFSYPSRSDLRSPEDEHPPQLTPGPAAAPAPKRTLDSLKAAAIGIHGVGETLRGTLNNELDTRLPRHNAEKAAAANAKNQAVLERGNREMAAVQRGDRLPGQGMRPISGVPPGQAGVPLRGQAPPSNSANRPVSGLASPTEHSQVGIPPVRNHSTPMGTFQPPQDARQTGPLGSGPYGDVGRTAPQVLSPSQSQAQTALPPMGPSPHRYLSQTSDNNPPQADKPSGIRKLWKRKPAND